MKIAIDDLYAINGPVKELYEIGLPVKLALQVKRLMKVVGEEIEIIEPERLKLMEKYQKGKTKDNNFILPEPGEEGFDDFSRDYHELFVNEVEIPYEKIDFSFLETDKRFENAIIKPKTFDVFEALNRVFDRENEKKTDVVDVDAEVKKIEDSKMIVLDKE